MDLSAFLGIALLVGCATPAPLVRLLPAAGNVIWVRGRASVEQEGDGFRVATAFEHQDGDSLEVRVEVENRTTAALEVEPREFTFTTCASKAVSSCSSTQRVIDPEQMLASLDERQSRDRAESSNSQALLTTLVLLSAAADVAMIATGQDRSADVDPLFAANLAQGEAARSDSAAASISTQQQIWSNVALRRSTLYPGHGIAGDVFIPVDPVATYVWLHVRTGARVFSFPFRQTITPVSLSTAPSLPTRNH